MLPPPPRGTHVLQQLARRETKRPLWLFVEDGSDVNRALRLLLGRQGQEGFLVEVAEFFVCDLADAAFDQVLGLGVSSFSDTKPMLNILGTQGFELAGDGFDVHGLNEKEN